MATAKEDDPLWMLRSFYFLPCDLMYQNLMTLKPEFDNEQTRDKVGDQFIAYMLYWFGGLYVVAEAWKQLNVNNPAINKMLDEHLDSLRLFRNAVFHFQLTDRKHVQFFDLEKFNWADKLHVALRAFFAAKDC